MTTELTSPGNKAVGGATVAMTQGWIDGWMSSCTVKEHVRDVFLINLGVNDMTSMPDSSTWVTNYLYIIDALRAKYTNCKIYITYPWKANYMAQANIMARWIDVVVNARPTFVFHADDERIWLENGDNGATMTSGGTHYSATGQTEKVAVVRAVLGL